jgi:hypothetical protein
MKKERSLRCLDADFQLSGLYSGGSVAPQLRKDVAGQPDLLRARNLEEPNSSILCNHFFARAILRRRALARHGLMDLVQSPSSGLPEIRIAVAQPIVPYDFGDFADFPARAGLPVVTSSSGKRSAFEQARYLQSWLFFGLLAECIGESFHLEDFVLNGDQDHGGLCISLANLPGRLIDGDSASVFSSRWISHGRAACDLAWIEVGRLEALDTLTGSPVAETALAILVLVSGMRVIAAGPSRTQRENPVWDSKLLRKRMVIAGWCPQQIASLFITCDPIILCYISRLPRGQQSPDAHKNCSDTACTTNNVKLDQGYRHKHVEEGCACAFISVDVEAIKQVISDGGIPLISIGPEDDGQMSLRVVQANSRSKYVAISHVWSDGLGNPNANALPECQLKRLIACIEQMPSDAVEPDPDAYLSRGVRIEGSEEHQRRPWRILKSFGLPTRQEELEGNFFWMDTLCIPVAAPTDGPDVVSEVSRLKFMAINQMALIYAGASRVLVLDSGLQTLKLNPQTRTFDTDILAHIVCSTWMRRCWTLQEGALARRVCFQSRAGVVTPLASAKAAIDNLSLYIANDVVPLVLPWVVIAYVRRNTLAAGRLRQANQRGRADPVPTHLRYRLQELVDQAINLLPRGLRSHDVFGQAEAESQLRQFCLLWNYLADRNTTMAEDLPAIFANLLDINAYQILELPALSRLTAILTTMDVLPLDLLFNDGPRLHLDPNNGFDRWIPTEPSKFRLRVPLDNTSVTDGILKGARLLKWRPDGNLDCVWSPGSLAAITLDDRDKVRDGTEWIVSLQQSQQTLLPSAVCIRLQGPGLAHDSVERFSSAIILLDLESPQINQQHQATNGCCLLVPSANRTQGQAAAVLGYFDRALTWRQVAPEDASRHPTIKGRLMLNQFPLQLYVQRGKYVASRTLGLTRHELRHCQL